MLAVLRSHRLPRRRSCAVAICLVLVATGCGGGGYGGSSTGGSYNPMPAIATLAPSSVMAGAAAQTLTISGSGFMSSSTATYNGVAHTVSYVSASQLTVQLSAADEATAGSFAVVVTNPAPGGGGSNSVNFTVNPAPNPIPSVAGVVPASSIAGSAAQTLTINGSGFMATSTVTYNGTSHTATYVSASQVTIQLSAADQAMAGLYAVAVTNPQPGGGTSASVNFMVGNPVPAISGLFPASASAGAMAQNLTINGTGFMAGSGVTYNGTARTATFVSATQLTIPLSTADQAAVGSYPVIVTNPTPGGGASNTASFSVAPVIPAGTAVLVVGGQTAASMPLPTSGEVYASSAFTGAGNLSVARYGPTASLIASGATVLIAGGSDASGAALKTAETYQVAAKTFGTKALSMQCAHEGHTATLLPSGQVLIAGRDGTTTTACAELHDPSTGFFQRTGDMTNALSEHAAVMLQNGKVLIVGGSIAATGKVSCNATNAAELYDPASGKFTATAHNLSSARINPTATLLASGKVLITGGGVAPTCAPAKSAELYDPASDTFTPIASAMSVERQFHSATMLNNGQVLVAGGWTAAGAATMSADLYDPATNTFASTGSMVSARIHHTATPVGNGVVLIVGGTTQLTSGTGDSSAELYDPSTGVFTLTGPLKSGRYGAAATPLQ